VFANNTKVEAATSVESEHPQASILWK